MNILKRLGQVATVAAPIVATLAVGPGGGAAVAAALGAGAGAKKIGKVQEEKNGDRPQKLAAPAAAVAGGAAVMAVLPADSITQICDFIATICSNKALLLAIPGLIAVLAHQLGVGGIGKLSNKEN